MRRQPAHTGFPARSAGSDSFPHRKEPAIARRSFTTFSKRQRELSRLDKQQEKAERREQRKVEKQQNPNAGGPEIDFDAAMTPLGPIRR